MFFHLFHHLCSPIFPLKVPDCQIWCLLCAILRHRFNSVPKYLCGTSKSYCEGSKTLLIADKWNFLLVNSLGRTLFPFLPEMTLSPPVPLLAQTVQTLALPDGNDDGLHFAVLPNCNTTSRKSRIPSEADFRLEVSSFSPIGRSGSERLREKFKSQVPQPTCFTSVWNL